MVISWRTVSSLRRSVVHCQPNGVVQRIGSPWRVSWFATARSEAHHRPSCVPLAPTRFTTHADDVHVLRKTLMGALRDMYQGEDHLAAWWAACEGTAAWSRGARTRRAAVTVPLPERGAWDDRFLQGEYTFC